MPKRNTRKNNLGKSPENEIDIDDILQDLQEEPVKIQKKSNKKKQKRTTEKKQKRTTEKKQKKINKKKPTKIIPKGPTLPEQFKNIDDDDDTYVGKLYADWCGHCKHMKNDWDIMQNTLEQDQGPLVLNVESSNEADFLNLNPSFEPQGYPTIFKKKPKKSFEYYKGPRNSEAFIIWAMK